MRLKGKITLVLLLLFVVAGIIYRELAGRLYFSLASYVTAPDLNYVKENTWSWDGGFKVGEGDFIDFDKSTAFRLQRDTIYLREQPRGIVKRLNKHLYQMTITSLDGQQTGTYSNVEESLQ